VAELRVLSALRIEALAVGGRVQVFGMGPQRAATAKLRASALPPAVAVVGVAGGVAEGVDPGDLVVANELRTLDGRRRPVPVAALLAAELERTGRRVQLGPIVSVPKLMRPRELAELGEDGALAVDMESAWLADALGPETPFVAVRAVADSLTTGRVQGGLRALRALRTVRPALETWAAAVGLRRIELAAPRSFCAGVERAIEIVERAIERFGAPVYVRRQIVHNAHVVAGLEGKGAVFVQELDEVPDAATVVLAAHGVSPEVRAQASARPDLSVVDATCPLVAKVHHEARRFASAGRRIVLVGHADHEEVVGTMGEVPGAIDLVESVGDVERLPYSAETPLAYLTQTTLAVDETAEVVAALRDRYDELVGPSANDICYASQNRQDAVRSLADHCDLVLVVGSANSSNAARLVEVARREGARAELIEDARRLDLSWLAGVSVLGVTAGASAPEFLVADLVAELQGLGEAEVVEHRTVEESVRFSIPLQVR
jgi:4-hydroxy-3-methylbut-2-en-1-yl diphosphate reductase